MRILHAADFHLGLANYGRPVSEFGATLARFVDDAISLKVDAAVIAGDLLHGRRPGPDVILIVVREIKRLRAAGIEVIIGPGNHDGTGTIADPDSHTLAWMAALDLPGVHVATGPEVFAAAGVVWAVLPYAHKRSVESGAPLLERTSDASRILGATIEQMGQDAARLASGTQPRVFVGHLSTISARLGSEAAMQMGWDTTIDPQVFEGFSLACLGHIHVRQMVSDIAWYAGSPDVHNFEEQGASEKGWWLHERGSGGWVHIFVPSRSRELLMVDEGDALDEAMVALPAGAVVRVQFLERPSPGGIRDVVARLKTAGASYVRVIVPEAERRYRGAHGRGFADEPMRVQMENWLDATGNPREPALAIAEEVLGSFRAE